MPVLSDCILWDGPVSPQGYPRFSYSTHGEQAGHVVVAKRAGIYRKGLHVLHKCDNRRCINPDHLYMGDNRKNQQDRVLRGPHNTRKVTPEQVRLIRAFEGTRKEAAKHFGVSEKIVKNIRCGYTWSWLS